MGSQPLGLAGFLEHDSCFTPLPRLLPGNDHLVMLTVDGDLFTCGCGEQGQLGRVPALFANRGGRKGLRELLWCSEALRFAEEQRDPVSSPAAQGLVCKSVELDLRGDEKGVNHLTSDDAFSPAPRAPADPPVRPCQRQRQQRQNALPGRLLRGLLHLRRHAGGTHLWVRPLQLPPAG